MTSSIYIDVSLVGMVKLQNDAEEFFYYERIQDEVLKSHSIGQMSSEPSMSTTATNWYSVRQLKIFQFCFGFYLTHHFYELIPHVVELFGREGMIGNPKWSPTYGFFPNIIHLIDFSSILLKLYLISLTCLSVLFAFRLFYPRLVSIILWYGWASLLNRNVLISNPGIPFVGLLLLAFSLIEIKTKNTIDSSTSSNSRESKQEIIHQLDPRVFPWIYWGSWTIYALGYTISGLHKLQSPSWIDGSALHHILRSPLSRNHWLCHYLLEMNPLFLQISTWLSLIAEISFLPLGLFYHTRKFFWFTFLFLHLGVLVVVNFTDLTLGVLTMHFFLLDLRWFQ